MKTLAELEVEASKIAQEKGHVLGPFEPKYPPYVSEARCLRCGARATCDQPDPPDCQVGGSAIRETCSEYSRRQEDLARRVESGKKSRNN